MPEDLVPERELPGAHRPSVLPGAQGGSPGPPVPLLRWQPPCLERPGEVKAHEQAPPHAPFRLSLGCRRQRPRQLCLFPCSQEVLGHPGKSGEQLPGQPVGPLARTSQARAGEPWRGRERTPRPLEPRGASAGGWAGGLQGGLTWDPKATHNGGSGGGGLLGLGIAHSGQREEQKQRKLMRRRAKMARAGDTRDSRERAHSQVRPRIWGAGTGRRAGRAVGRQRKRQS